MDEADRSSIDALEDEAQSRSISGDLPSALALQKRALELRIERDGHGAKDVGLRVHILAHYLEDLGRPEAAALLNEHVRAVSAMDDHDDVIEATSDLQLCGEILDELKFPADAKAARNAAETVQMRSLEKNAEKAWADGARQFSTALSVWTTDLETHGQVAKAAEATHSFLSRYFETPRGSSKLSDLDLAMLADRYAELLQKSGNADRGSALAGELDVPGFASPAQVCRALRLADDELFGSLHCPSVGEDEEAGPGRRPTAKATERDVEVAPSGEARRALTFLDANTEIGPVAFAHRFDLSKLVDSLLRTEASGSESDGEQVERELADRTSARFGPDHPISAVFRVAEAKRALSQKGFDAAVPLFEKSKATATHPDMENIEFWRLRSEIDQLSRLVEGVREARARAARLSDEIHSTKHSSSETIDLLTELGNSRRAGMEYEDDVRVQLERAKSVEARDELLPPPAIDLDQVVREYDYTCDGSRQQLSGPIVPCLEAQWDLMKEWLIRSTAVAVESDLVDFVRRASRMHDQLPVPPPDLAELSLEVAERLKAGRLEEAVGHLLRVAVELAPIRARRASSPRFARLIRPGSWPIGRACWQ